tara:strand:+ start:300 stop:1241 length:942 start_codon:yes stop_codon:yes gene_type:complete
MTVITAVESVIKENLTNFCMPRNSYINRVYEVETQSKERFIVKFYRPNRWSDAMILGEHSFLQKCRALELPVIPPLTYDNKTLFTRQPTTEHSISFAIFPKKGGRVIDELNEDLWKETGRLLGRIHCVGETIKESDRTCWRPSIATQRHLRTLEESTLIPQDYVAGFGNAVRQFIQQSDPLFNAQDTILIHGDCHFGNIIYRPDESLYLVDFDDSVMGPPVQDLWMLLPDSIENCQKEVLWFIDGYSTFRDFTERSLRLIPALRVMRQIHFSAWCAIQSLDVHFKHHFPEWGSIKYWNTLLKDIMAFKCDTND